MAPKNNKVKEDKLRSPNFKVPLIGGPKKVASVIAAGAFSWKLDSFVKGKERFIQCKCSACGTLFPETWSINGINLRAHFESNHRSAFNKLVKLLPPPDLVKKLPPPDLAKEDKNEAPHPPSNKSNTKAITVDSIFTNSLKKRPSSMTLDEAKSTVFDTETQKMLFLEYLMANNLPLAHTDSPALTVLLAYARRCDSVVLPTVNRQSMKAALDIVYRESVDELKSKLTKHKGKFALTLDEWKSGNNFDFLAVTFHYHDSDFKMRKYVIGFEVLNKDVSYTGEVLYRHLNNVLTEYNIKDRIISITRDKASPINSLVN